MAKTVVRDYCVWAKHMKGDPRLVDRVLKMRARETISLVVDNVPGVWQKMADDPSGRPTDGLKPIGLMKPVWASIYRDRKGEEVEVSAIESYDSAAPSGPIEPPLAPTEAEREAAWRAFKALWTAGWRSDGPYGPRDELYDRD